MSILVTSPYPESTVEELGIKSWPILICDISSFDWAYEDREIWLLLEGEVTVMPEGGQPFNFSDSELVFTFPVGVQFEGIFLKPRWLVSF